MSLLKISAVITVAAGLIGAITGCQPAVNTNSNTTVSVNTAPANTNQTAAAPAANTSNAEAADASTPTGAYKAAYAARKNKDVAALKKLMSKDIIEFFTMMAEADDKNKQTLDELLKEITEKPQAPTPEVRNEKINGDRATVEYLDETGEWDTMDFEKEDGMWKLSLPPRDEKALDDLKPVNKGKKK
jgi:hypothetical protein